MSNQTIETIREALRAMAHDSRRTADWHRLIGISDREEHEKQVIFESALAEFEAEFGKRDVNPS